MNRRRQYGRTILIFNLVTIKWQHPGETPSPGGYLGALPATRIEVVLEPSGTYGDSLRGFLRGLGCEIYLVSPKRVHDAAEVYDGVPSLHDAKAAYLIGRLHLEGDIQAVAGGAGAPQGAAGPDRRAGPVPGRASPQPQLTAYCVSSS